MRLSKAVGLDGPLAGAEVVFELPLAAIPLEVLSLLLDWAIVDHEAVLRLLVDTFILLTLRRALLALGELVVDGGVGELRIMTLLPAIRLISRIVHP